MKTNRERNYKILLIVYSDKERFSIIKKLDKFVDDHKTEFYHGKLIIENNYSVGYETTDKIEVLKMFNIMERFDKEIRLTVDE